VYSYRHNFMFMPLHGGPITEDTCKLAEENTPQDHIRVCTVLVNHTRELG
jgi:hypothetical protein